MKGATLLFEPLPIGRVGVRWVDDEVVLGTDYSSFAYILEEFIALGIHKIAIPKSFPEISALSSAPQLLKQRISMIDDAFEIESANRLLHPIMSELEINVDHETGNIRKPKRLPETLFSAVLRTRRDLKCLAVGLNKSVQIELDADSARTSARMLREVTNRPVSRTLLASIEGLLSYYEEVSFHALSPPLEVPRAMVSIFDRLVNDPHYMEYSEAVATLSVRHQRNAALSTIQRISRTIASSKIMASGWDYVTKAIKVCSGLPLPDSNVLSALFPGKSLPTVVDLQPARQRAIDMWVSSAEHDMPYNRSGSPFPKDEVDWIAPSNSIFAPRLGATYLSLGTVGELRGRLEAFLKNRTTSG